MRRIAVVFLSLVMVVLLCVPSFADGEDVVRQIAANANGECENVTLAVRDCYKNWKKYIGDDYDTIEFELMFQVFYLSDGDIFGAYDDSGSFGDNISEKYYWVVPSYEKGGEVQVVRNENADYGWSVRSGTTFGKTMGFNYPDIKVGIVFIFNNILDQYPDTDTESFRFVYCDILDCYLMYFTREDTEYIVPYFTSTEITWMQNEKIYKASEFIATAEENYDHEADATTVSEGLTSKEFQRLYVMYIVLGSVIVAAIAVVSIVISKKKINKF